jgi:hypothetical protein
LVLRASHQSIYEACSLTPVGKRWTRDIHVLGAGHYISANTGFVNKNCFVGWDELGQWADPDAYNMLRACLRYSAADIPKKRIRATGNPGGPGHHWIKQYFIDHAPNGCVPIDDLVTGMTRMFIRSRVEDNRVLLERDPGYIARLRGVGSEALVRAWLEGDWSAVTGAFFGEISDAHIIRPFPIPQHWTRLRSFDWGSARPFSCGWWAVSSGQDDAHQPHDVQRGALVRYREWYGCDPKKPNTGLKMRAEDVAAGIKARSFDEEYALSVADPAIFKEDGGPSIAEVMRLHGIPWRPADNERLPGWQQLRARLIGNEVGPLMYVFDTCRDWIRTMPTLQHDEHRAEDIDTDSEDHQADETRYLCMARPLVTDAPHEDLRRDPLKEPAGKLLQAHFNRSKRRR